MLAAIASFSNQKYFMYTTFSLAKKIVSNQKAGLLFLNYKCMRAVEGMGQNEYRRRM